MNTVRSALLPALLILSFLTLARPAPAEVLDQAHEGAVGTPASVSFFQGLDRAQTFTAGLSGRLRRVEVMLSRTPPPGPPVVDVLDLDLRATEADGRPVDGAPIALTSSVSTDELSPAPAWIEFEFGGAGVPITAGERLALVVRAPFLEFPDGVGWAGILGDDGYAGGSGYRFDLGAWAEQPGGFDGNFRTFVEVPEPAQGMGAAAATLALRALAPRRGRRRA
jgi:hypothetical protein